MSNAESTISLLEQCLPLLEESYLRYFLGEPWCPITMSTAIMLLKIHLGKETWESAKYSCAQRFLDLHYKHVGRQQTALLNVSRKPQSSTDQIDATLPATGWLDSNCADVGTLKSPKLFEHSLIIKTDQNGSF